MVSSSFWTPSIAKKLISRGMMTSRAARRAFRVNNPTLGRAVDQCVVIHIRNPGERLGQSLGAVFMATPREFLFQRRKHDARGSESDALQDGAE